VFICRTSAPEQAAERPDTNAVSSSCIVWLPEISLVENQKKLLTLISKDSYSRLTEFLKHRAKAVQNNISARHDKKLHNLNNECTPVITSESKKWVVNLSSKPLSTTEQSILEKSPKFAPTTLQIPYQNIVAEIEAAITKLPDESKDAIRTSAPNLLRRSRLPNHKNITTNERKAIDNPRKDKIRIVMKADKGNCFVVTWIEATMMIKCKNCLTIKTPIRKYLNPPSKESNAN
jgi:hypothetical protein